MAWNGSDGNRPLAATTKKAQSPVGRLIVIVGVAVVVLCAGVIYFVFDANGNSERTSKHQLSPPADKPKTERAATSTPKTTAASRMRQDASQTNGSMVARKSEASDEEVAEVSNATKTVEKPRVFESASDQLIAMATTTPEGGFIPPIPTMNEGDTEAFIKSYRKPLEIKPDDSEKIKKLKEHINNVRDQIAGMIAQNPEMSLSEILNAHRDRFNSNSELSGEAQSNYDKLIEEGNAEVAEEYRQKANELLSQTGAPEIKKDGEDDEVDE